MDWSDGYFTELEYTHGYYDELSPGVLRLSCLAAGIAPPKGADFNYLELGYGQGLSVNIHAASTNGIYWGTDFNPTQAVHAQAMAGASGANPRLLNESFEQFAAREDLPQFDIIALHGIWSWVSDKNKRFITDIIRRNLRVGGIVYVSYNCLPGWAAGMPIRHLMTLHSESGGADIGGAAGKIDSALNFALRVADAGALYFQANPGTAEYLRKLKDVSKNYLAHEYFNRDWSIMNFSEVNAYMENAKLSFASSASLLDHMDDYHMMPESQKLMAEIKNPVLRQSVRDYVVNQRFRRDIFVKGSRKLTGLELREEWLRQKFVLMTPPADVPLKIEAPLGELTLDPHIYEPIIQALADKECAPKTVAEIREHPGLKALEVGKVVGGLMVLGGLRHLRPAQEVSIQIRERSRSLNRYLCERAFTSSDISSLAAPAIGGGVRIPREHQLALLAKFKGNETPEAQASYLSSVFEGAGETLIKAGKTLAPGEETTRELKEVCDEFAIKVLPLLRSLDVI